MNFNNLAPTRVLRTSLTTDPNGKNGSTETSQKSVIITSPLLPVESWANDVITGQ